MYYDTRVVLIAAISLFRSAVMDFMTNCSRSDNLLLCAGKFVLTESFICQPSVGVHDWEEIPGQSSVVTPHIVLMDFLPVIHD